MKNKERVLFSSYYEDVFSEDNIEFAKDLFCSDDITEEDIEFKCLQTNELDWDEFDWELREILDSGHYIIFGKLGLWNGAREVGKYLNGMDDLKRCLSDCDYIKFYEINNHFYVQGTHHDGTNFFEIRQLNDKGVNFYLRHRLDMYDSDLLDKLATNNYSKLPHIHEKIYGY